MRGRFPTWLAVLLAVAALGAALVVPRGGGDDDGTSSTTEHDQIARVLAEIDAGGPFPYREDGEVFENREGELPAQPRGYYHAYTVADPGQSDRGARRLVTGSAGEVFYTADHYNSFEPIDPEDYK